MSTLSFQPCPVVHGSQGIFFLLHKHWFIVHMKTNAWIHTHRCYPSHSPFLNSFGGNKKFKLWWYSMYIVYYMACHINGDFKSNGCVFTWFLFTAKGYLITGVVLLQKITRKAAILLQLISHECNLQVQILRRYASNFNLQKESETTSHMFNGSQLAKMKKSIPDMSLPWNL